ncbi:MAG: carboxypeptidase-like regulatory domain-containing protein, partial [Bacteroidota bacterium]
MLLRAILLIAATGSLLVAQAATITGYVEDASGNALVGATVVLKGQSLGTATDVTGRYVITDVPANEYVLVADYIGYATQERQIRLNADEELTINFELSEDAARLEEVVVAGKSASTARSQTPIQVASIDVVKLQSESAELVTVLDRTAGVRVRQSGGLGSNTIIQLNGLTGRAVRTYLDGIPLDVYSG